MTGGKQIILSADAAYCRWQKFLFFPVFFCAQIGSGSQSVSAKAAVLCEL